MQIPIIVHIVKGSSVVSAFPLPSSWWWCSSPTGNPILSGNPTESARAATYNVRGRASTTSKPFLMFGGFLSHAKERLTASRFVIHKQFSKNTYIYINHCFCAWFTTKNNFPASLPSFGRIEPDNNLSQYRRVYRPERCDR